MAALPIGKIQDYLNPLKLYLLQSTTSMLSKNNIQAINAKIQKLAKSIQPIKVKNSIGIEQNVSLKQQGTYQATASVQTQKNGNVLNVAAHFTAAGTTNSQLASQLNQTQQVTVKQPGAKPTTTTTQLAQNKDVNAFSQFTLDKTVNSAIVANTYQKVGGVKKETSIATDTAQNLTRNSTVNAATDTTKIVTQTDKKGNTLGESFNRTIVNQATETTTNQDTVAKAQRDVSQDITTNKTTIGGFAVTKTNIDTEDVRSGTQSIQTQTETDSSTTVASLNKDGDVIKQYSSGRTTDYDETRDIKTQENINSQREILSAVKGQERISLDTEKIKGEFAQSTAASASTVVTNLKGDGTVASQQTYLTNTESDLSRVSKAEVNRVIKQDSDGIQGAGNLESKAVTDINTTLETIAPSGAVSTRAIERTIVDKNSTSWAGDIQLEDTESGGKLYSLKNIDIAKRAIADVTKEGINELKVTTNTNAAKMVNGSVEYKPAEQVTPVNNVAGSGVGISFASYTGIASGFKLDTGEVNFNFTFASADFTKQEAQKSVDGTVVGDAVTKSGQKTDASLTGKLVSVVNEDGSRLITINASYQKEGAKLVVDSDANTSYAKAKQETNMDVQGTILVSRDGDVKKVESNFDMYKTEDTEASGTSLGAVRKAMDMSDPLRKSFYFDNGMMRFNLGFATLNFAVYA